MIKFLIPLLLLATSCFGMDLHSAMMMVTKQQANPCTTQTTPNDMETSNSNNNTVGNTNALKYVASKITGDATSGTVCKVCLFLAKQGSPTMTLNLKIYADSGGNPTGSGTDFGSINAADIAGSFGDCFTGSLAVGNGTAYHLVLIASAIDTDNYVKWGQDATCTTERTARSADGSSWTEMDTDRCLMAKLYK